MSGALSPSQGLPDDGAALMPVKECNPSPDTLTSTRFEFRSTPNTDAFTAPELVRRLRAMTLQLLPVEVDPPSISEPTSRVITPQVIAAYKAAAGDFVEAVS